MPKVERLLNDYIKNNDKVIDTTHEVTVYNKRSAKKNSPQKREYFFKKASASAASKEASAASFYRLLVGNRVPDISLAYNSQKQCGGTISKEIDGFIAAASVRQKYRNFDPSSWVKSGLARILVSSMIFAEGDLTEGNWGFNNNGNVVRIDFDRSLDYVSHPITERDVLNLLELKDFNASAWPRIVWVNKDNDEFKAFEREKWHYFLKAILPTKDLWLKTAYPYNKHAANNDHIEKQIRRIQDLKTLLINLPQFQDFLLTNPDSIDLICEEFSEYNQQLKADLEQTILVDIKEIKIEYKQIIDEVKKKVALQEITTVPSHQTNKDVEDGYRRDYLPSNFAMANYFFAKNTCKQINEDLTDNVVNTI
jgi:hypothetical protein